jgi:hypothetical protein
MKVPRGQQPQRLPLPIFLANQLVRAPSPSRVCDERAMFSSFLCALCCLCAMRNRGATRSRALDCYGRPAEDTPSFLSSGKWGYCKAGSSHQPLASSVRSLSHRGRSR